MRVSAFSIALLLGACNAPDATLGTTGRDIVSLHDVTTEIIVALGATGRLVGIAEPTDITPELTRAVARIERVGSLESLLSLHPTAVLGLTVVEDQDPDLVRHLRNSGIDVQLADPETLEDTYALTRAVGQRLGLTSRAEELIAGLQARVAREPSAKATPARVFVYDCCDPPFTAGRTTVLTDLIDRAGGRNVFADLDADWAHVSWEQVVARRPELIVVHSYAYDGQGDASAKHKMLLSIEPLARVPIVTVPLGWSLGGLRSVEGLERLRTVLRTPP